MNRFFHHAPCECLLILHAESQLLAVRWCFELQLDFCIRLFGFDIRVIHWFHTFFPLRTFSSGRRDGVVVRASASQSVDLGFISIVESYQKTLKNGIHSFPAWRSAHKG